MKFKSALLTTASGSVGGMVAAHNRGGLYLRARSIPVNTNTAQQQVVRNFMAQCAAAWVDTLTEVQRAAWALYADFVAIPDAFGDPRKVPPLAMYCRSNVARLQAGLARIDEGPTSFFLPPMTAPAFAVDASDDDVDVSFNNADEWATAVGGGMLVFASRPQNATINYFNGPYRFAGLIAGAVVPPVSPATIELPFPVVENHKVFFQVRVTTADGRLSSPFRGVAVAAA